jgi:hypothetical protein
MPLSAPSRRLLAAAAAALVLSGCGAAPAAAPRYRGTALPTAAGPVHPDAPPYRGPHLALFRTAARYFRWPVLVPEHPPGGASPVDAMVSRLFGGTFAVDASGHARQVPGSYVPSVPVRPAAYQLRIDYLRGGGEVTLFEAVHPYTPPASALPFPLPAPYRGGRTWTAPPGPGAPPLRYVEGERGGLYLMAYGPARRYGAAALAAFLRGMAAVAVPPGPAPRARLHPASRPG